MKLKKESILHFKMDSFLLTLYSKYGEDASYTFELRLDKSLYFIIISSAHVCF